ncbi:MAG: cysteine desulfurase-like protein [Actinomycetota bacterium]|nr:cysteine desulfurase-like protein [Actinomycetota bacterium]
MTTMTIDVERARSRFSALRLEVDGHTARFFDGAGGSQVPDSVIDAIAGYLRHTNANEGGVFVTSQETNRVLEGAHVAAADLLGATPAEIAFGANMTTLNFLLTHAYGRTLEPGDEIVVTQLDHEGNVSPWRLLARDRGLAVHIVGMNERDGSIRMDELHRAIGERTRVVAFPLASNAIGTVPDVKRIVGAAHRAGALAWADGVHAAPHLSLDFAGLDLDVLMCSPYKFFGPHLGIAAIREELAAEWPADRVVPAAETPAGHRYETGTLNHEALAGVIAAVDYIAELSQIDGTRRDRLVAAYAAIGEHEQALSLRFLEGAAEIDGLTVHGNTDAAQVSERTPTFLVTLAGQEPVQTAQALAERGFFAWHGDFYAPGAIRGVGLEPPGGVRLSFLHYNTAEEIDDLLATLRELA